MILVDGIRDLRDHPSDWLTNHNETQNHLIC